MTREISIVNLHPVNEYLFPIGKIRAGRYYSTSGTPISGKDLQMISDEINEAKNTFGSGQQAVVEEGNTIRIPFCSYYQKPLGLRVEKGPVNISNLPTGVNRWEMKDILGHFGSDASYDPEEAQGNFRLLMTPLITVPKDIVLIIQNRDHLESRLIDGGFEHMIIGEFSDKLLKSGERRTAQDFLSLKAYRKSNVVKKTEGT